MASAQTPDGDLSFVADLPLTQKAIAFAEERHQGQRRSADGAPFLVHPLEVAVLLDRSEYPDHVVAAAVLHDVLEDTDADAAEVASAFGTRVAELVALVSDDPSIEDEEERKDDVRQRVARTGGDALVIYAADKVCKVRELRMLVAAGLDSAQTDVKLGRYQQALEMLEQQLPGDGLVEILRFELETLQRLPPERDGG